MDSQSDVRGYIKRLLWLVGTVVPVYLMLTIFMPPGFAGVPWMLLVMAVFFAEFGALLAFERSVVWNGAIAFLFWIPMVILHLYEPGTETVAQGKVMNGVVEILAIAAVHAAIQSGARLAINLMGARPIA